MRSVKGTYQNGVVLPAEPVDGRDGEEVIITFVDPDDARQPPASDADWDRLLRLVADCKMETGISDLAHQHDHYLHGAPKKP